MVRLADWPRAPYLNDEVREWISLHLATLGVSDVAVFATVVGRDEDERRVLVATEIGLLDSWYAPRGSSARYGLSVRLYPWQTVHGVDLRGETTRLWAYEHESRWRLRIARPALDLMADTAELGHALARFAAACAVMAEPAGSEGAEGRQGQAPAERAMARPTPEPARERQAPPRYVEPMPEPAAEPAQPPPGASRYVEPMPEPAAEPAQPPPGASRYVEPMPEPAAERSAPPRYVEPMPEPAPERQAPPRYVEPMPEPAAEPAQPPPPPEAHLLQPAPRFVAANGGRRDEDAEPLRVPLPQEPSVPARPAEAAQEPRGQLPPAAPERAAPERAPSIFRSLAPSGARPAPRPAPAAPHERFDEAGGWRVDAEEVVGVPPVVEVPPIPMTPPTSGPALPAAPARPDATGTTSGDGRRQPPYESLRRLLFPRQAQNREAAASPENGAATPAPISSAPLPTHADAEVSEAAGEQVAFRIENGVEAEPIIDLERRLGLRPRG